MATYSGTPGNDVLIGTSDDDEFFGNGGNDRFEGRNGNDIYHVDDNNDVVVEFAHHGYDTIYTVGSYTLAANAYVEVLSTHAHAGTTAVNLTGNGGDNVLIGNAGANILHGGGGAGDRLAGLGGDDIYYLDVATVQIVEEDPDGTYARGGYDKVYVSVSYVLAANVAVELLSTNSHGATVAINLTGNGYDNEIWGNAGANLINGGGGAGDRLIGLGGDDSYIVEIVSTRVFEAPGGGNDTVYAGISYVLSADQEIERLATSSDAGTAAINLTGNGLANELRGNAGANILDGRGGDDVLVGLGGNDSYYVDSAADQVFEIQAGGDRDIVYASVSYTLPTSADARFIEVLSTVSHGAATAIDLTGNEERNEIIGNAGINILDGQAADDIIQGLAGNDQLLGGEGADRLYGGTGDDILDGGLGIDAFYGGTGDDTYYVDSIGEVGIREYAGEGADILYSTALVYNLGAGADIEILALAGPVTPGNRSLGGNEIANELRGDSGGNTLAGLGGDDVLLGFDGDDTFAGGTGMDVMTGGTGSDSFFFQNAPGPTNIETITDFETGIDTISLNGTFFNVTPEQLQSGAFQTGPAATEANDRIIYDPATGALYYDSDGIGAAAQILFAMLDPGLALTGGDFG